MLHSEQHKILSNQKVCVQTHVHKSGRIGLGESDARESLTNFVGPTCVGRFSDTCIRIYSRSIATSANRMHVLT